MSVHRQRGFTLIELLVVLLIIGVVLSLAPVAFHRVVPSLELKSAARQVAAVFREARSLAIRDNREAAVIVDTVAKTYSLATGNRAHRLAEGFGVSMVAAASEQIDDSTGQIRFFPDGSSTGGRLTLSKNEREYHIVVDWLTGRAEIFD